MTAQTRDTAIVTGAGSGFGEALAGRFARAGMAVAAIDIDGDRAEQTARKLQAEGADASAWRADIGDRHQMETAAAAVRARHGSAAILCANAAVVQFGAIESLSREDWQWILNVNVIGVANTVAAFLPLLRAHPGRRRIAITASASVLAPGVRLAAYIASKAAVTAYAEVLRMELEPEGIGVSILFPSAMTTRQHETSARARPAALGALTLRREDVEAMKAGYRHDVGADLVSPEFASRDVVEGILENRKYIITHGTVMEAMTEKFGELRQAHERSRIGISQ